MPSGPASAPLRRDLLVKAAFAPAERPRQVLVYAPLAYSTPHFETDLEIAQRHLDAGDAVDLVLCDGEMPSCQLNPKGEPKRCVECISRNLLGAAQLSARVPVLTLTAFLTPEDHAQLAGLPPQFRDQASLRRYRFDGFDAGLATLSSMIDFVRSVEVDPSQYAPIIRRTLEAAVATYLAMHRVLRAKRYDCVYIYNGRWSMSRAVVRACERARIPYYTHERGADLHKFALFENALPHDMHAFRERVRATWADVQAEPATLPLAEAFFQERRNRVERAWFSFTKDQELGRCPADWERTTHRIVLFTSSEFEFAAIGEDTIGRIYESQTAGARRIAQELARLAPASHLWIRVHPNDTGPHTTRRWQEAAAGLANVTLILPEERIDSYALLDGAERVLTFGSTMGIEATYWNKPSISADFSFYDGLDAQYDAHSEPELLELLTREGLPPKPRERALWYGYYLNTFGDAFQHYQTDQISDYSFQSPFRGRGLRPDYADLRARLLELHQAGNWFRAASIARVCARFRPEDALPHSIGALSLLRLGALPDAVAAVEQAATQASSKILTEVVKVTAQPLLDAVLRLGQPQPTEEFRALGTRLGGVLARVPLSAEFGRKLLALAAHPGRPAVVAGVGA